MKNISCAQARAILLLTCCAALPAEALADRPVMTVPPPATVDNSADDAREILSRYVRAWRGEQEMELRADTDFAVSIRGNEGGKFHVRLPMKGQAALFDGLPATSDLGFETDIDTLRRLDRGEWTVFTAMAQAIESDPIPLEMQTPDGFEWTPDNRGYLLPLLFHFWNREWPEVIRFGEGTTRFVHGGNAAPFVYTAGLRSSWYQVKPGMHINDNPRDQVNEFDSFVVVTRGAMSTRLGGMPRIMHEGEAVLIPAGMTHEFWATGEQYAEFVLLMFGSGA